MQKCTCSRLKPSIDNPEVRRSCLRSRSSWWRRNPTLKNSPPVSIKISYLSGRTISRDALLLQNVGPQKGFEALCIVDVGEEARVGIMRLVRIFGAGGIDRDIHPHQA